MIALTGLYNSGIDAWF